MSEETNMVKRLSNRKRRIIRAAVIARDSELTGGVRTAFCMWCGDQVGGATLTVEHIKPLSEGGTYAMENLGIACRRCNIGRISKQQ